MSDNALQTYFDQFGSLVRVSQATDSNGQEIPLVEAVAWAIESMREITQGDNKIIFVGNGGSAAISSHMATDYSNNGQMRAMSLNDGVTLTCLGNDFGYENAFAKQLDWHARPGDFVVAISSSGRSQNILNAVDIARQRQCAILTLSGFREDNPLRTMGDINIYVPSTEYGFVEIMHLAFCHNILDRSKDVGRAGEDAAKTA